MSGLTRPHVRHSWDWGEGVGQENVSQDSGVKGRISAGDTECMCLQGKWTVWQTFRNGFNPEEIWIRFAERTGQLDLSFQKRLHVLDSWQHSSEHFNFPFFPPSSSNHGHKWFIGLSLSSQIFPALVCLRGPRTMGVVRDTSGTAARESSNETFLWALVPNASQSPAPPTSSLPPRLHSSSWPCPPPHLGVQSQLFSTRSQVAWLVLASTGKVSCLGVLGVPGSLPGYGEGHLLALPCWCPSDSAPNFAHHVQSSCPSGAPAESTCAFCARRRTARRGPRGAACNPSSPLLSFRSGRWVAGATAPAPR